MLPVLVGLVATGCAGRSAVERVGGSPIVCVDGLAVDPGRSTVMDVLASRASSRRWVEAAAPGSTGPLVLIDGIEDGLSRLTTIAASEVRSVETLEPDRAVPEFGAPAAAGAILLRTHAAARRDAIDRRSPPPHRCGESCDSSGSRDPAVMAR